MAGASFPVSLHTGDETGDEPNKKIGGTLHINELIDPESRWINAKPQTLATGVVVFISHVSHGPSGKSKLVDD